MCFVFQQTEVYQLNDKGKDEANTSWSSPRMFLTGVAQQGAGPTHPVVEPQFSIYPQNKFCAAGSRAGLPTVPCRQRPNPLTWRDQRRVRKRFALHVHLMLVLLAEIGHASVDGPGVFRSHGEKPPIRGGKPLPSGYLSTHHSRPPSAKFQDIESPLPASRLFLI